MIIEFIRCHTFFFLHFAENFYWTWFLLGRHRRAKCNLSRIHQLRKIPKNHSKVNRYKSLYHSSKSKQLIIITPRHKFAPKTPSIKIKSRQQLGNVYRYSTSLNNYIGNRKLYTSPSHQFQVSNLCWQLTQSIRKNSVRLMTKSTPISRCRCRGFKRRSFFTKRRTELKIRRRRKHKKLKTAANFRLLSISFLRRSNFLQKRR